MADVYCPTLHSHSEDSKLSKCTFLVFLQKWTLAVVLCGTVNGCHIHQGFQLKPGTPTTPASSTLLQPSSHKSRTLCLLKSSFNHSAFCSVIEHRPDASPCLRPSLERQAAMPPALSQHGFFVCEIRSANTNHQVDDDLWTMKWFLQRRTREKL